MILDKWHSKHKVFRSITLPRTKSHSSKLVVTHVERYVTYMYHLVSMRFPSRNHFSDATPSSNHNFHTKRMPYAMNMLFTLVFSVLLGCGFTKPLNEATSTSIECDPKHFPDLGIPLAVSDIENAFQITVIPQADPNDEWSLNLTAPANGKGGLDAELLFPGFEAAYFNLRNGTLYVNSSNQTATVGYSPAKLRFGTPRTNTRLEVHARLSCRNEKLTYALEFIKRFGM